MKKIKLFTIISVILISFASNIHTTFANEETPDYTFGRPMTAEEIAKQKSYEPDSFITLPAIEIPESQRTYGKHGAYYPAKYDSRTYGLITSVKFQEDTNWCWAYFAASALETAMIKADIQTVDTANLSEASLAYYMYHRNSNNLRDPLGLMIGDVTTYTDSYNNFTQYGGNTYLLSQFLTTNMGVKNENYYTREQAENGILPDLTKAYTEQACVLKNAIYPANDKESIKSAIQSYGSVCASINWEDSYFEYSTSAFCYPYESITNHEITIIGWDDNYKYINFPENSCVTTNGAWIAKNSWDTSWGDKGYFYISYEDASLVPSVALSVSSADSYDNNYTYVGSVGSWIQTYDSGSNCYFANVYTANGREQLTEVAFDAQNTNMRYSIQIYKNVTSKTNPESGTAALKSPIIGTATTKGIYTLPVTEPVYLDPGERYSIVVQLFSPSDGRMVIGVEHDTNTVNTPGTWYEADATLDRYQSFERPGNSSYWYDAYNNNFCARIIAHTNNSNFKKVTFKDSSGKLINCQYVQPSGNANIDFSKKTGYTTSFNSGYTNITKDTEIIVKWSANTYKITLEPNKGKTSKQYINTKYNSKFSELPSATRRYYKFLGWYTNAGRKITASTKNTYAMNMTLKAKWGKVSVPKASITKVTSPKKKTIKVTFKKITNATGYSVKYSTNKNMKGAKTINTTKTSKTLTGLKSKKTYYIQVRAIKKDSLNKRVYGEFSSVKSIKVK